MIIDLDTAAPATEFRAGRSVARWGPAVVLLLTLALLGGAAPPAPERINEAAVIGSRAILSSALGNDAIYTMHAGREVRATPLMPGGPRWSVTVDPTEAALTLDGSRLLVNAANLTVLDAATGRTVLVTQPGEFADLLPGRAAVRADGKLRMVSLADGRTLWQRDAELARLAVSEQYVVMLDDRERMTVFATGDGRVVGSRRGFDVALPAPVERLLIVGDRLYAYGRSYVLAFGLPGVDGLWFSDVPGSIDQLIPCGPTLCVFGADGIIALDPATGSVRWTGVGWFPARMASGGQTIGRDGLVVADGETVRVDLVTGKVLERLGDGGLVGDLTLRNSGDRMLVFGGGRVLGDIPHAPAALCEATGELLSCRTARQTVTVWRVDRP